MAKNVTSNPRRAIDLTAKKATTAVSKNFKQSLTTLPEMIIFYNTGKCLFLGKFVCFYNIQMDVKTDRLSPSAPFESNDSEQKPKKK